MKNMTLINKKLNEIIGRYKTFLDEYEIFYKTLIEFPNPYAYEKISKDINEIQTSINKISVKKDLEILIKKQLIWAFSSYKSYADYHFKFPDYSIDKLLQSLYGKNIVSILNNSIKSIDYKKIWEYYRLENKYSHCRLSLSSETVNRTVNESFNRLKKKIVEWGYNKKILPEDLKVEIILSPYRTGSNYDPETKRIEIDMNFLLIFDAGGEININPLLVIPSVFHEYFGHALNGFLSKNMPLCFQADFKSDIQFFNKPVSEGLANMSSKWSIDFLKENYKEFDISKDDIDYLKLLLKLNPVFSCVKAYFEYLKFKKMENPQVNISNLIRKISNNVGFTYNITAEKTPDMKNMLYHLSIFYGDIIITETEDKIRKMIKRRNVKLEENKINNMLLSINSAPEIYSKNIKFLLTNNW